MKDKNRAVPPFQLLAFIFLLSPTVAAQERRLRAEPPAATVLPRQADVLQPLNLPPLDGALLANLLHEGKQKAER
jgi:hypothetical protein